MNSEEDEFKRIEAETKRRAMAEEDDDTQTYTSESADAYSYRCGYEAAKPPPEWEGIKNIIAEYGLDAIAFVADWKSAQRPWVGLTDDEMTEIVTDIDVDWGDLLWKVVCLTKIIEARLEERNNG